MEIIMFNSGFSQPEDLGILLKDIIETDVVDAEQFDLMDISKRSNFGGFSENKEGVRPYKNDSAKSGFSEIGRVLGTGAEKTPTVTCSHAPKVMMRPCELRENAPATSALCHHVATATDIKANESNKRIYAETGKSPTLTTMGGGHREPKVLIASAGRNSEGVRILREPSSEKTPTITARYYKGVQSDGAPFVYSGDKVKGDEFDYKVDAPKYRKLTPKECMRLQGFPGWCIDKLLDSGISNSQLYKMTGNGWAIPVIVHNLKCLLDTGWME